QATQGHLDAPQVTNLTVPGPDSQSWGSVRGGIDRRATLPHVEGPMWPFRRRQKMQRTPQRAEEERSVVAEMRRVAAEHPQVKTADVKFKQDWAYGNAGLENDEITREQVEETIRR